LQILAQITLAQAGGRTFLYMGCLIFFTKNHHFFTKKDQIFTKNIQNFHFFHQKFSFPVHFQLKNKHFSKKFTPAALVLA
jgi:hypothetical protein